MTRQQWLLLLLASATLGYLLYNRRAVVDIAATGVADVTAALTGWQTVNSGPTWVPVINQTEDNLGIPHNLLARMAYQESSFRDDVINGTTLSTAGALGILQLMPNYFDTVRRPTPYSPQDTVDQISQAGQQLLSLYNRYQDWALALAAYNDGANNIDKYLAGVRTLPGETANYVAKVLADVPIAANTLQA